MTQPKYSVIVTGSSRGIGKTIALTLASKDLGIVVNFANNRQEADNVVAEIKKNGGSAIAVQGDVSKEQDAKYIFDEAEKFAPVQSLNNNAGVVLYKKISDISLDEYKRVFDTNVQGTFLMCREASKRLVEGGHIINFSSSVTALMLPTYGIYSASKGAVEQMTRVLAKELGARRIAVNCIAPGPVGTDLFFQGKTDDDIKRLSQMAAFGRIGETNDIANAVQMLLGSNADWITGQIIRVNGGFA